MGPTRKLPSQSSTTPHMNNSSNSSFQTPSSSSTPLTTQIPAGVSLGMSPTSRYNHNIKVLRRRDPSIMSIFDQFSFVCLYHHDGEKWLKHGFEGTMFLFERNTYPPYGLYILNRVGSEDYIQAIYPEDELISSGAFLIIKTFPKFLAARLRAIQPTPTGEPHDRFSDVYAVPGVENIPSKDKGPPTVISLWMLAVSSRDTMTQTMQRLHSYIRQNKPYPEELRYGPGKPPPPHSLRAATRPKAGSNSESESQLMSQSDSENDQGNQSDAPSAASGRLSQIDLLFQHLQTPSLPPTPSHIHQQQQQPYEQTTNITLNTLFASASNQPSPSSGGSSSEPVAPYAPSGTGKSLLNTIFASAGSQQQQPPIFSPQPSTTAPQILTQDVLSNLLGLPPTRTASAASTFSASASAVSHPSSREGDNEDDGESESPGGLMDETDGSQRRGPDLLHTLGLGIPRLGQHGKINGDVTPRGPVNSLHRPPFPSAIEAASSISTVRPDPTSHNVLSVASETANTTGKPRANRSLVPFEPDSELWPYSRGPVSESSPSDAGEDGEIVELSFEDTSLLSDPDAFDNALRNRRSTVSLRGQANGHRAQNGQSGHGDADETAKGKKSRKTRKELRDAKAKEEIERTWDLPVPSPAAIRATSHLDLINNPPASPSPSPSPENHSQHPHSIPEMKTPTMNANVLLGHANGNGHSHTVSPHKGKTKAVVNGRAKLNGHANRVDAEIVNDSLIASLDAQRQPIGHLERNEFVKEVLTLIHTDKSFVDTLWQEYMARHA